MMRRIAVLMSVCEGEQEIAGEALASVLAGCGDLPVDVQIVDDASALRVGEHLVQQFSSERVKLRCYTLPSPLGFRGTSRRLFLGLSLIAESTEKYDLIVKLDPDALVLRTDWMPFISESLAGGEGLAGDVMPMRWRDRVLYLADLLPMGFRRKTIGGKVTRAWELRRGWPTWWWDFGGKAMLRGPRFRFVAGGFCAMAPRTLAAIYQAGYLTRKQQGRNGFVNEDDILITTATAAVGHPVIDLGQRRPGWAFQKIWEGDIPKAMEAGAYVAHPLKANPRGLAMRASLRAKKGT